jgi:hypothetical protein
MQRIRLAIALSLFALTSVGHAAEVSNPPDKVDSAATIAPGTVITATNWRDYEKFMPEGMAALFAEKNLCVSYFGTAGSKGFSGSEREPEA